MSPRPALIGFTLEHQEDTHPTDRPRLVHIDPVDMLTHFTELSPVDRRSHQLWAVHLQGRLALTPQLLTRLGRPRQTIRPEDYFTRPAIITALTALTFSPFWESLIEHPTIPTPLRDALAHVTHSSRLLDAILNDPDINPTTIRRIYRVNQATHLLQHIAAHPHTPSDLLATLYARGLFLHPFLATNPQCPADWLAIWGAGPGSSELKLRVAQHPHTPPEVLTVLATASQAQVRAAVRDNPATPDPIRLRLTFRAARNQTR